MRDQPTPSSAAASGQSEESAARVRGIETGSAEVGGMRSGDVSTKSCAPASCISPAECLGRYPIRIQTDAHTLYEILCEVTQCEPVMWGPAVIGFGQKQPAAHPNSADDGFEIGFSRRKATLVLVLRRYAGYYADTLARLGGEVTGKNAIILPPFTQIDTGVLRELLERAWSDRTRA